MVDANVPIAKPIEEQEKLLDEVRDVLDNDVC